MEVRYLPTVQTLEQVVVLPVPEVYVPAPHTRQAAWPALIWYVPASHGKQVVLPVDAA